jgi:COMPASS component SWD2
MYWSLHDNSILCSFIGHTDSITSIDLSPSDSTFVSCSKDFTTRVWEYEKKACKIKISKSRAACFDNTGMILACLYIKDREPGKKTSVQQVHLFNTENYEERPFSIFSIDEQESTAEIKQMKFSPDGQLILLGSTENSILLIDSFDGKLKHKFNA